MKDFLREVFETFMDYLPVFGLSIVFGIIYASIAIQVGDNDWIYAGSMLVFLFLAVPLYYHLKGWWRKKSQRRMGCSTRSTPTP